MKRYRRRMLHLLGALLTVVTTGPTCSGCERREQPSRPPAPSRQDQTVIAPPPVRFRQHDDDSGTRTIKPPLPAALTDESRQLLLGPDKAAVEVRLHFRTDPAGRVLERLSVASGHPPRVEQTLDVHDAQPLADEDQVVLGTQDVNFDGHEDIYVVSSAGATNAYANYWLSSPTQQTFAYLGIFPVFRLDARRRRLTTHENTGHAGREYIDTEYAFASGTLVVMQQVTQTATEEPGVYEQIVSRRRDSGMQVVARRRARRR